LPCLVLRDFALQNALASAAQPLFQELFDCHVPSSEKIIRDNLSQFVTIGSFESVARLVPVET
jgi:hypothetical protein